MEFKQIANFHFVKALQNKGGEVFLVGGIVRDHFLGIESKDIDLVVRNLDIHTIMSTLSDLGKLTETTVADKMGILKFVPNEIDLDEAVDIAIPRTERLMTSDEIKAEGITNAHNAFIINSDPHLPIATDLERRDFTINSIAFDLKAGTFIDPFGGQSDILDKVIKHTSDKAFSDDPLRMFRAVQFASRFKGFGIHDETFKMISDNKDKAKGVAGERIHDELMKIFNKGDIQKGIRILSDTGLHSVLFGNRPSAAVDTIKTKADFFFHLCNSSTLFKKVLKGDTETAKGIDAIHKANSVLFTTSTIDQGNWDMPKLRLALVDAVKVSPTVLDSGKLIGPLNIAQEELKKGKFPKSLKELDVNGGDLIKLGMKPGEEMGDTLKDLLSMVMMGTENKKETLLKVLTL